MIQKFDIDVYNRTLCICTGSNDVEMSRYFDTDVKLNDYYTSEAVSFRAWHKKVEAVQVYVVCFPSDKEKTYRTVAHEALHIANYLAQDMGIQYDPENTEAFAYLAGYVADCICKTMIL